MRGEDLIDRLCQFLPSVLNCKQSQRHASNVAKSPAAPSSIPFGTAKLMTDPIA
jgi:hypothetical protein